MAGAQTEKMQEMNYKNTSRKYLKIEGTSIRCETNFSKELAMVRHGELRMSMTMRNGCYGAVH